MMSHIVRSQGHVLLGRLFMCQVEEEDAGQGTDQEDHVKPAMIKVKLEFSQYLGHYGAVLQGHAHTHEEHGGDEIHSLWTRERVAHSLYSVLKRNHFHCIYLSMSCGVSP